jgi:hypothetical protein
MNLRQAISTATTRMAPLFRFASTVPARVWMAAAALLFAGLWLQEHDARVRRAAEAAKATQQAAAQIADLKAKADAAVREANQRNAAAIAELETQRRKLAARGNVLSAQLETLKRQEQESGAKFATLPPEEVARLLTRQLGPSGIVQTAAQPIGGRPLALSVEGQRKVGAAIAERDSCREQGAVRQSQISNCRNQLVAGAAEIQKQADSLTKLNQALVAKDEIFKGRESEFKTQLRAARGTWHGRMFRALKYIAAGAAIGVAIR